MGRPSVEPGDVVAEKYRVERIIGRGGMGVVVAATHIELGNRVALKFLLPNALANKEAVVRFEREARAAVALHSDHVSRVLDVGRLPDGAPYIVMELLDGVDLARRWSSWPSSDRRSPLRTSCKRAMRSPKRTRSASCIGISSRRTSSSSDGICAANACLIPLDRDPFPSATVTSGWREQDADRVVLPKAVCERSLPVMIATKCATKVAPTCGPWSAVGTTGGAPDASLPIGDASLGDAALPPNVPAAVAFVDADPRERFVSGTVTITRAPNESDVTGYALYWADGPAKKLGLIANLPKTGNDVTHPLAGEMPPNATHLIAASTNGGGEIAPFVQAGPIDNFTRHTYITVNAAEIRNPKTFVDKKNSKLLIAGFDLKVGVKAPALIRCNLDATGCQYVDISTGIGVAGGDWNVNAVIDEKNDKLIAVSDRKEGAINAQFFQCNLDGTGCIRKDLGAAVSAITPPLQFPVMIDTANDKLVAVNSSATGVIYRCNLDGEGCVRPTYQNALGAPLTTALISPSDAKLLIISIEGGGATPVLRRCDLDGTSCQVKDISAGDTTLNRDGLSAVIDPINQKLLVVGNDTNSQTIHWWRCNLDGTACTSDTLGDALPSVQYPCWPHVVVDVPHQHVFVFATTQDQQKAVYYRCEMDLTGCVMTPLAGAGGRFINAVLSDGVFYATTGRYNTPGNDFVTFKSY